MKLRLPAVIIPALFLGAATVPPRVPTTPVLWVALAVLLLGAATCQIRYMVRVERVGSGVRAGRGRR